MKFEVNNTYKIKSFKSYDDVIFILNDKKEIKFDKQWIRRSIHTIKYAEFLELEQKGDILQLLFIENNGGSLLFLIDTLNQTVLDNIGFDERPIIHLNKYGYLLMRYYCIDGMFRKTQEEFKLEPYELDKYNVKDRRQINCKNYNTFISLREILIDIIFDKKYNFYVEFDEDQISMFLPKINTKITIYPELDLSIDFINEKEKYDLPISESIEKYGTRLNQTNSSIIIIFKQWINPKNNGKAEFIYAKNINQLFNLIEMDYNTIIEHLNFLGKDKESDEPKIYYYTIRYDRSDQKNKITIKEQKKKCIYTFFNDKIYSQIVDKLEKLSI